MIDGKVIGCPQIGAQRAMRTSVRRDQDRTSARSNIRFPLVNSIHAIASRTRLQDL